MGVWPANRGPWLTHEGPSATEFQFYPPDHSVVQAHNENGCIPFENVGDGEVGFYSGPQIVSGISDEVSKAIRIARPRAPVP